MSDESIVSPAKGVIALVGFDDNLTTLFAGCDFGDRELKHFPNSVKMIGDWTDDKLPIVAIIANSEIMGTTGLALAETLKKKKLPNVPLFLIVNHLNANLRKLALTGGIVDVFRYPLKPSHIEKRANFLIDNWSQLQNNLQRHIPTTKKIELSKRIFDLFFAGSVLICLSPLFLIIYILIKLESKGPAFYYSLRVGTGYKVFKFYKFRSMFVNADKRIKDMAHLNQYNIDAGADKQETQVSNGLCDECKLYGKCQYPLYADNNSWCEKDFRDNKKATAGSAFFKILTSFRNCGT
jgi:hypothetical protein